MKYQKIFDTFVCIFLRFILQEKIFTKEQDFRKKRGKFDSGKNDFYEKKV